LLLKKETPTWPARPDLIGKQHAPPIFPKSSSTGGGKLNSRQQDLQPVALLAPFVHRAHKVRRRLQSHTKINAATIFGLYYVVTYYQIKHTAAGISQRKQ
jgi:hypothetical protein